MFWLYIGGWLILLFLIGRLLYRRWIKRDPYFNGCIPYLEHGEAPNFGAAHKPRGGDRAELRGEHNPGRPRIKLTEGGD